MSLPFYQLDAFGYFTGLALATLIGFAFGFVLERSGFGRGSILAAQFYFTDMRVLKVMFSAIVTALVGMTILGGIGLLDVSALVVPETFLWPQLVGGLLLGAGFIVSGYCPGTGVVAMASGKWDGLTAIAGVMGGSVLFGYFFPLYSDFYTSGAMGVVRLPDLLGVPQAVLALGVSLMAIGAFIGAEKVERMLAEKQQVSAPAGSLLTRRRAFAAIAAGALVGLITLFIPAGDGTQAREKELSSISALELAQQTIETPESFYLVDLRGSDACSEARIPGAMCIPDDDPQGEFMAALPPTRRLVLYGDGDLHTIPAAARQFGGEVVLVEGGYRAFDAAVLEPPAMLENPTPQAIEEFRLRSAMHAYFTGARTEQPAPTIQPVRMQRAGKKKGGGC